MRMSDWSSDVCASDLLSCGSTGLCEGRHVRALAVVAALARQLRRGRLDVRAEHARAEPDFLLRPGPREMRGGQQLANLAENGSAAFRGRVCKSVMNWVVAVAVKKKHKK